MNVFGIQQSEEICTMLLMQGVGSYGRQKSCMFVNGEEAGKITENY